MDDKIYLMLKEAGFETGFQNTFIENNSAKFDKFVELIREDEQEEWLRLSFDKKPENERYSEESDLYLNALNYRTASSEHADECWHALIRCVGRLIIREREATRKQLNGNSE